jgi:hypothetical protein
MSVASSGPPAAGLRSGGGAAAAAAASAATLAALQAPETPGAADGAAAAQEPVAAAAAALATAEETAAAVQHPIDKIIMEMTEEQAQAVKITDLANPVLSGVLTATAVYSDRVYAGDTTGFAEWQRHMAELLNENSVACLVPTLSTIVGADASAVFGRKVVTHKHYTPLVQAGIMALNAARVAALNTLKSRAFNVMYRSLKPELAVLLVEGSDVGRSPTALYDAVALHARGAVAAATGEHTMQVFYAAGWDKALPTLVAQFDAFSLEVQQTMRMAAVLGPEFLITFPMARAKIVHQLPTALQANLRTYNAQTTMAALHTEIRQDCARIDNSAAGNLAVLTVREDAMQRRLDDLSAKLERALTAMASGRHGNGGGGGGGSGSGGGAGAARHKFTDAQMMDRDFRPTDGTPWPFTHFCSHHGHSTTHGDDKCFYLHPELQRR